jgi:hypothetical protein
MRWKRRATYHDHCSQVRSCEHIVNQSGIGDPDIGRTVAYNNDELYRVNTISDSAGNIARWLFYGPDRLAELGLGDDGVSEQNYQTLLSSHVDPHSIDHTGNLPAVGCLAVLRDAVSGNLGNLV